MLGYVNEENLNVYFEMQKLIVVICLVKLLCLIMEVIVVHHHHRLQVLVYVKHWLILVKQV